MAAPLSNHRREMAVVSACGWQWHHRIPNTPGSLERSAKGAHSYTANLRRHQGSYGRSHQGSRGVWLPPCALILDDAVDDVVDHMGRFLGDAVDRVTVEAEVVSVQCR